MKKPTLQQAVLDAIKFYSCNYTTTYNVWDEEVFKHLYKDVSDHFEEFVLRRVRKQRGYASLEYDEYTKSLIINDKRYYRLPFDILPDDDYFTTQIRIYKSWDDNDFDHYLYVPAYQARECSAFIKNDDGTYTSYDNDTVEFENEDYELHPVYLLGRCKK